MAEPRLVVAPIEALADEFARLAETSAARALAARGRFAFVIPGGSAADAFLPRLANARLDWSRTHILYSDERFVPRRDPASSAAASARLLFDGLGTRGPHVYRMVDAANDVEVEASRYAARLTELLGREPSVDLALLGIGEDGHTASLFPGRPAVETSDGLVLVERASPKPPATRLTLSLGVLSRAREVVFAAFGDGKAGVVRSIVRDPNCTLPAARVLRAAPAVTLLLDPAAGAQLPAAESA